MKLAERFRSRSAELLCAIAFLLFTFQGHAQQSLQVLHNHVRSEVSNGQAALVGPVPATQRMQLSIVLPLRNQTALTDLLGRLYDPSSSDFRHFLSVEQFTQQFSPTEEDYQTVVKFAKDNGFTVTDTPANRLIVPISGTAAQVEKALNLRMNNYQHPTENRVFFSPDREPSLNLSVAVAHIAGLNNFSVPRPAFSEASGVHVTPAVIGSAPDGSFLSSDMRAAYYGGGDLTGSGQAIGIVEFDSGYSISDVTGSFGGTATSSSDGNNYIVAYTPTGGGITYNIPINNVLLDGTSGATYENDLEQVLDIVQAIGMAPGLAQARIYIGTSDVDILNSMAQENICKELSISWQWIPDDPSTDDPIFQEFAAQGQSVFVASGDNGGYNAGYYDYYPSEDPYVTTVGGTDLVTNGAGGSWNSETAWIDSGGGISPDGILLPNWQTGAADSSNGGSTALRNVPDVAMEANYDNYVCAAPYGCIGGAAGTSFATPRWAAFMALVNQQAEAAGRQDVGFVNPAIYSIGAGANYSSDFNDISSGNNDCCGLPLYYNAVTGYDLVTGWGSPHGQNLIDALAGPLSGPVMTLAASPNVLTTYPGASGTANVLVNALGGFNGSVNMAISGLPNGVTASFSTNPTSRSSLLTITASTSATPGSYLLIITGTSGALTASASLALTIAAPGFSLAPSSGTMQISPSTPGTNTITVTRLGDFNGSVSLAMSGLPSGVTALFSPNPTTGSSVLTLTSSISATTGKSRVNINGTSGNAVVSTSFVLVVDPAATIPPAGYAPSSVNFGSVNIGTTSAAMPLSFTFTANTTLSSTSVLTDGAPGLDFNNAGSGTCTPNAQFLAGGSCVVNVTFTPGFAGTRDGAVVLLDSNGNAIATGYVQGSGLGPQVNFLPNAESAVVSSGLDSPYGVSVDGSGNVYIADTGNLRILKESLSENGYTQSTVPTSTLSSPLAIAVDGSGDVYIADNGTDRILKETPTSGSYSESVVAESFDSPLGVAVDGSGNVYFVVGAYFDPSNNLISGTLYKETLSAGGYSQTVIPTPGVIDPAGVAVDGAGDVYITENDGGISPPPPVVYERVVKEAFSSGGYTQSVIPTNGLGTPWGIAVDANGNVYISDTTNKTVLKETLSGESYIQSTISTSQLDLPVGIAVQGNGNLYIADTFNWRILKEDFADPPSLSFLTTQAGLTSSDSPKTVTVTNTGSTDLTFPPPATGGTNPSVAPGFTLGNASTCPQLTSNSSAATLAPAASCTLLVSFSPTEGGIDDGSLVLTDDALNATTPSYAQQTISLSGTGIGADIVLTPTSLPAAVVSTNYQQTITATGGTAPYTYAATGALPGGLTLSSNGTLSGSPTAAGTANFTIKATDSSSNPGPFTGSQSYSLVVAKATATVTLGNLNQTYTGSPLSATASTNPAALSVNFTYNGSATAPTAAGSYAVVATINDPNYTGTASGTLVIAKATAMVTFGNLNQTYIGSPLSATASTNPAGLSVNFTYNGSATAPTAVGSYTVVATINDPNYAGTATGTLVISKLAIVTMTLGNLNQIYTGLPLSATATTNPPGLSVSFTYNGLTTAPTAAGSYAVVATINDSNYAGTATGALVIAKATAAVTLGDLTQTYTGSPLSATAMTNPPGLAVGITYNGSTTAPTAPSSYAVVATINDPNYAGTASGTLVISNPTAPAPVLSSMSPAFISAGGSAFTITTNGSGFTSSSTVYWGTSALITQYVSTTQLTAQVQAFDISSAGTGTITVQTPAPGRGTSNSLLFEVDSATSGTAAPTFTSSTATVVAGSAATYAVTLPSAVMSASVTCLNLPTGASCSYSPTNNEVTIATSSTTPKGTYQVTVIFTETVSGAAGAAILLPFLVVPLAFIRRKLMARGIWFAGCAALVLFTAAVFSIGCGGGSITRTSSTQQVTSSGAVTLTIQ
jgi:sugar lactone lactonase YvrE